MAQKFSTSGKVEKVRRSSATNALEGKNVLQRPETGSFAVIGLSFEDGVSTIKLLKKHNQGDLVLKRHGGQRPHVVGSLPHRLGMPVGTANQQAHGFDTTHLALLHPSRQIHAAEGLAALVEEDAEGLFRGGEELFLHLLARAILNHHPFELGVVLKTRPIGLHSVSGPRKDRFANSDDAPSHDLLLGSELGAIQPKTR